jgi:hypothetical protein
MPSLRPRNNSGYAISPAGIIFLAILGAAFAVCCGVVILRFYGEASEGEEEHDWRKRLPAQDRYMWTVRRRGMKRLSQEGGGFVMTRGARHVPASSR